MSESEKSILHLKLRFQILLHLNLSTLWITDQNKNYLIKIWKKEDNFLEKN